MTIQEKLIKIQNELKAPKDKYNSFGKYNYRSAESILEAIKPLAEKHKCLFTISEDIEFNGDVNIIRATARVVDAEGVDIPISCDAYTGVEKTGGMALPQAFGSASSYAKKYALGNLLLIDDTKDADATNTHGQGKPKLTPEHKNWAAAVKALKSDSKKLASIKAAYELSSADEKKLKAEAK